MAIGSMTTNSTVDLIDKTLKTENAPADAKAVGDYILDAEGNVIFYSKAAVDKLLAKKLDLTGGTMTGTLLGMLSTDTNAIEFTKSVKGDNMIRLRNTETGADVGIGIGGLGSGIGIWDFAQEQWIINGVLNEKSIFIGNQYCAGFVVASGSDYVRFGDGTQICRGARVVTGALLNGSNLVTYPMPFSEIPTFLFAQHGSAGGNLIISGWETTTTASLGVASGATLGDNFIPWIAIGKWK